MQTESRRYIAVEVKIDNFFYRYWNSAGRVVGA